MVKQNKKTHLKIVTPRITGYFPLPPFSLIRHFHCKYKHEYGIAIQYIIMQHVVHVVAKALNNGKLSMINIGQLKVFGVLDSVTLTSGHNKRELPLSDKNNLFLSENNY